MKGHYFVLGEPREVICIGEGFATCATLREATSHAVVGAFDCGNLKPVSESIRAQYPNARIVLAADDDYDTDGNPGLTKARDAATAIGGSVAVPDFGPNRPADAKDFNDLSALAGLDAVRRCIEGAIAQPPATAGSNRMPASPS